MNGSRGTGWICIVQEATRDALDRPHPRGDDADGYVSGEPTQRVRSRAKTALLLVLWLSVRRGRQCLDQLVDH